MRQLTAEPEPGPRPVRVAIVGGGAAGVLAALHLLARATEEAPVDVHVIERAQQIGPGLAYRPTHPWHTVNNFAGRLSAVDGDPDHLLRWSAAVGTPMEPTDFPRRDHYGRYLAALLDDVEVPAGSALRRTRAVVTDVVDRGDDTPLEVRLSDGWSVLADEVVLALGTPPPRPLPEYERLGERYVADPWHCDLAARLENAQDVLLVGTGHTALDVVAAVHAAAPLARFTAVSRRGLLPRAHRRGGAGLHDTFLPTAADLDGMVTEVSARLSESGDWRRTFDSLRAGANTLWSRLDEADQEAFVHRHARSWEIARHRTSPDLDVFARGLLASGRLRLLRTDALTEDVVARMGHVVNCTGPAPVPTRGWNRLVDALLDRGVLRLHRLGLGVDLDGEGHPVDADGTAHRRLHVLGAGRKGLEWEVGAIPDLRVQGAQLAATLIPHTTVGARPRGEASTA